MFLQNCICFVALTTAIRSIDVKETNERILTSDEKWAVYNNVKRKRSWSKREELAQTTWKPDIYQKKCYVVYWWDFVYFELLPDNTTINSEAYWNQLDKLSDALKEKKPGWLLCISIQIECTFERQSKHDTINNCLYNSTLRCVHGVYIIGCQKSLAAFLLNFQLFIKLVTIMRFKSNMRRFVRWRVPNGMPTS